MTRKLSILITLFILLCWSYSAAFDAPDAEWESIREMQIHRPEMLVSPTGAFHSYKEGLGWNKPVWIEFLNRYGDQWDISIDHRSGRPDLIQGSGIPWIPGDGNDLGEEYLDQYGLEAGEVPDPAFFEYLALRFIDEHSGLFKADREQIKFDEQGSYFSERYVSLRFTQKYKGTRVWKSHLFFRINNGNLIQFGSHFFENVTCSAESEIGSEEAFDRLRRYLSQRLPGEYYIVRPIEKMFVPVASEGKDYKAGEPFEGEEGTGYDHKLVYELYIGSETSSIIWHALTDAHTGELLILQDARKFGVVQGGIYPVTNSEPEVIRSFPYAAVSNNGTKTADLGGNYFYDGGMTSCNLNGLYVRISDSCGTVDLSNSFYPGNLNFGSGAGTDCSTPGFGGGGNTHTSRSCFYLMNWMKEKIRYYQPGLAYWVDGKLRANGNINSTCNAYWDGSSVNFYKSGGGCSNTGELAAVILHETSHGLDDHDQNGFSADEGSGEAYADTGAFLMTHSSCIGHNFRPGVPCSLGCDSSCTGVRDVDTAEDVTVWNIESSPADCDRWSCPYWGYMGPMGYEGHCESLIASQAWWDAIKAVRNEVGDDTGWVWADRLWYIGLAVFDRAYQLVSGGRCNPGAQVNGCNSDSYYNVLLGIDDDDGNLANGTPHGCRIWEQFNAHGIACGMQPQCFSSCPSVGRPEIEAFSTGGAAMITWEEVAGADSYEIFRNDIGCDYGWFPMGIVDSTFWPDHEVAVDRTYFYAVQAIGEDTDCRGQISECESVVIIAGPTNTPGPPTNTPTITPTPTPSPCIWAGFNPLENPVDDNRYDNTTYFYDDGDGTGSVNENGVLTGWSVKAMAAGQIALRIIRPLAGNQYSFVGGSQMVNVSYGFNDFPDSLNIPVQQGDIAALYYPAGNAEIGLNGSNDYLWFYEGDVADTVTFTRGGNSSRNGYQLVRIYGDCDGTPTPTPTPTPTATSDTMPTITPSPEPTENYLPDELCMVLELNQSLYTENDPFKLTCRYFNPDTPELLQQFIILDCNGLLFFWPSWSSFVDYEYLFPVQNVWTQDTILDFIWPENSGAADGLVFFGAFLDPGDMTLACDIASAEFGFN